MKKIMCLAAAAALAAVVSVNVIADITVKNKELDAAAVTLADGTAMVPVRAVAEELGFSVDWDAQARSVMLTRFAQSLSFAIGTDGYAYGKMAAAPLGQEPILVEGKAYVPVKMFSELLALDVKTEGESIIINEAEEAIVVKEIADGQITVEDPEKGEVVLIPAQNAKITDSDGSSIKLEDIVIGSELEVKYGEAMTMSLPPINNPTAIRVVK